MTWRPETLAVQAGQEHSDPVTHARALPIYQTVAYEFDSTAHAAELFSLAQSGNIYGRITNPTDAALEERVNALEGGVGALATSSGMAAVTYAVLNLANAGDNVIASSALYGGSFALLSHTLAQFGIGVSFVDVAHPEEVAEHVNDHTKAVFAETLSNPSLAVLDIAEWSKAAHDCSLPLIVDNTVPSPFLCRPIEHGADVVVHSATKYLGGHGTTLGGVIVDAGTFDWGASRDRFWNMTGPDPAYHGTVWTDAAGPAAYITRARTVLMRNMGATLSPMAAWQLCQGIETLHLRMERHSANALAVANFLNDHPAVSWVNYPGLESDPQKPTADRMFTGQGYGGLISFGLSSGRAGGGRFIDSLNLLSHLANIGDAKSLAIHNATTTHSQLSHDELAAAGVPAEMVRLSIGIEHVDDIIDDIDQALAAAESC